eukprot:1559977-Rhodomonas_salina.2
MLHHLLLLLLRQQILCAPRPITLKDMPAQRRFWASMSRCAYAVKGGLSHSRSSSVPPALSPPNSTVQPNTNQKPNRKQNPTRNKTRQEAKPDKKPSRYPQAGCRTLRDQAVWASALGSALQRPTAINVSGVH